MLPTQVKCDKEPPTFLLIKSYGLAANERKGTNQISSIKTKNWISAKKIEKYLIYEGQLPHIYKGKYKVHCASRRSYYSALLFLGFFILYTLLGDFG